MSCIDPVAFSCTGTLEQAPPECVEPMKTDVLTNQYCGLITDTSGVFKACIAANPTAAAGYMENCRYDVCANQDNADNAKAAACGSLEAFATQCLDKGFVSDWRLVAGCRKWSYSFTPLRRSITPFSVDPIDK